MYVYKLWFGPFGLQSLFNKVANFTKQEIDFKTALIEVEPLVKNGLHGNKDDSISDSVSHEKPFTRTGKRFFRPLMNLKRLSPNWLR